MEYFVIGCCEEYITSTREYEMSTFQNKNKKGQGLFKTDNHGLRPCTFVACILLCTISPFMIKILLFICFVTY